MAKLGEQRNKPLETSRSLDVVRPRQKALLAKIRPGGKASQAQTNEMNRLAKEAKRLQDAQAKLRDGLKKYKDRLQEAGVSSSRFADTQKTFRVLCQYSQKHLHPFKFSEHS